jgi:hypothetical protein
MRRVAPIIVLALTTHGCAELPPERAPDIVTLVQPLFYDLGNPEYLMSRCLLAPVLSSDKRTIAMSRDSTFVVGDRILSVEGQRLSETSDRPLHRILMRYPPDAALTVRVLRAGSELDVKASCIDNRAYFALLRAAATAAVQDDAATCADRMQEVAKMHALGSTWLNVSLNCREKAGRITGAAMRRGYFEVYQELILENKYSATALEYSRPMVQAAAQYLRMQGNSALAAQLKKQYEDAAALWLPPPASDVALQSQPPVPPERASLPPATPALQSAGPVVPDVSAAKRRRASDALTALNKDAIQLSNNGTLLDRAHQMTPYFLKKLDPSNADWNDRNPGWPAMAGVIQKSLLDEISNKPTSETLHIETLTVGIYAAKMTDADLQQMNTYLSSAEGKRYAAFQTQLESVFNEGIRALQANHPMSQEPATDVALHRRLQLLSLSNSAMITVAQYDSAQSQHADISGFSALPSLLEAVATYEGAELDALATRFDADIPQFVSFNQTITAKHHFAALAAAQAVGAPMLLAQVQAFLAIVEAKHMAQWQHAYEERIQGLHN